MRVLPQLIAAAALIVAAQVALVHADEPTTKPTKDKKEMTHGPRLVQPYSKMTTLTPDEKEKIAAIHKKAVDDAKVIEDKEASDIDALLTAPQKAELEQIKDEAKVKNKTKEADKKAHPATEPSRAM